MYNKNQKSLFREITNENINTHKRTQRKIVDKKVPKNNKLTYIFESLRKLKTENESLRIRFKESESLKNKIFGNFILEITNRYNKEIEQLNKANKKMKEQMNKCTDKRNNQYKRILNILTEKQQELAMLQKRILGNPGNKNQQQINMKEKYYQQQIQSLNLQINNLKIEIEIKNQENKELSYELKKYKLFGLSETDDPSKVKTNVIYKEPKSRMASQSDDIITPINSKSKETTVHIQSKNSTKRNLEDNTREIKILNTLNHTPQKSTRNKKLYLSNNKHKQDNNASCDHHFRNITRNSSTTKKSFQNSFEMSNENLSKEFKNALQQYNRQKKSKVSYYYR